MKYQYFIKGCGNMIYPGITVQQ